MRSALLFVRMCVLSLGLGLLGCDRPNGVGSTSGDGPPLRSRQGHAHVGIESVTVENDHIALTVSCMTDRPHLLDKSSFTVAVFRTGADHPIETASMNGVLEPTWDGADARLDVAPPGYEIVTTAKDIGPRMDLSHQPVTQHDAESGDTRWTCALRLDASSDAIEKIHREECILLVGVRGVFGTEEVSSVGVRSQRIATTNPR